MGLDHYIKSPEILNGGLDFISLVARWNRHFNLTGFKNEQEMVSNLLLDSFALLPYLPEGQNMVDLGSGSGVPGIPLSLACPRRQLLLLDRSSKKVDFLAWARLQLALGNVSELCADIHNWQPSSFPDIVVSRALMPLPRLLDTAVNFCSADTHLLLSQADPGSGKKIQFSDRFDLHGTYRYSVPGISSSNRCIMHFQCLVN